MDVGDKNKVDDISKNGQLYPTQLVTNVSNHQHKLSLTSVTDIDVALYLHKSPNLSPTSVVYITLSTIQDAINIASATKSELFPSKKGTYM